MLCWCTKTNKIMQLKLCINVSFREQIFVLRKGQNDLRERRDKHVVIIEDPNLDKQCTAYTDSGDIIIYIAFSTVAILMIINTETLAVEIVELSTILDIRHVLNGELIFADVSQPPLKRMTIGQLEDRYWKSKLNMEEVLRNALTELKNLRASEIGAKKLFNDPRRIMN
ncbi:hypothetical protein PENTCL1PPCAC_10548 [Pristionchus entomophagus]|uniref:Uncharacterized protein n=1 Tax=Pristionchus entomophagus TaxID=358040 RepID=A0AAV5T2F6_9BILA|nr:hypothetical protein PENTCL1PPCAC_10548 [Pristionchus entomophagus]